MRSIMRIPSCGFHRAVCIMRSIVQILSCSDVVLRVHRLLRSPQDGSDTDQLYIESPDESYLSAFELLAHLSYHAFPPNNNIMALGECSKTCATIVMVSADRAVASNESDSSASKKSSKDEATCPEACPSIKLRWDGL